MLWLGLQGFALEPFFFGALRAINDVSRSLRSQKIALHEEMQGSCQFTFGIMRKFLRLFRLYERMYFHLEELKCLEFLTS